MGKGTRHTTQENLVTPTVTQTHRDTAEALLSLHQGSCSVVSNGPIHLAFCEMQERGEVKIRASGTPGYMDIWQKGVRDEAPKV